jgi:uncharacterized protein (DUF58 family)
MKAAARLIPPTTLASLANLELLARTVVEGTLIGLHRSPRLGFSQEFAEYRGYVPGDDPRFIDWNVLARSDRMCVKRYFGDTNARLAVLLDASASMGIEPAAGAVPKLDYARYLAAALIHLAARQHDAVGLTVFSSQVTTHHPPSARVRAAAALYHQLESVTAAGRTGWPEAFLHIDRRLGKRALVAMISDFYGDPAQLAEGWRTLQARGHDLLVLQVLDPAERQPQARSGTTLEDVETGQVLEVSAADLQQGYPRRLAAHQAALKEAALAAGGHYVALHTEEPLDRSLAAYLRFRERHP